MSAMPERTLADTERLIADLQHQLDECRAELAARNSEYGERIAHQSATVDVLKVMSASPGDPQPVFDLIVERARDLCDGYGVTVYEFDGTLVHWRAATGVSDDPLARQAFEAMFPMAPTREFPSGRAILDRQVIHARDYETEPWLSPAVRGLTVKSSVSVPLIRRGAAIGALVLGSRERGGFSDSQVELLKTFAEQAVIAIATAETYRELQQRTGDLQQSLEYQTATSDVLKVISRSTSDLQPVLDTLAETAARLCGAEMAFVYRRDGDVYKLAANSGFPPEYEAFVRDMGGFDPRRRKSISARAALLGRAVHVHDVAAEPGYSPEGILLGKIRTGFALPLLCEGEPIGVLGLARQRVAPFTERQLELVRTFADQAVIAMENARLLTDTREALEQQTATAEVLQVINSSPGDLAPVFDSILEKAHSLCGVEYGALQLFDGQKFRAVATRGNPEKLEQLLRHPYSLEPTSPVRALLSGEPLVEIPDVIAHQAEAPNPRAEAAIAVGIRSALFLPLRRDNLLLGTITAGRKDAGPFLRKQIALLQNFAAQAVIAMENARLLTETREALEQQTATAEVLQVINSSPGDLAPVFEAMLAKAMRLCEAAFGHLDTYDGTLFHTSAMRGVPIAYAEYRRNNPPNYGPGTGPARMLAGERIVHHLDMMDEEAYRRGEQNRRALVDLGGARSAINVALVKDRTFLGFITLFRQEVRPFSDKQIALVENFAAQAVIAMENARLLNELQDRTHDLQESLEYQTATSDVLKVISRSTFDLQPVLDAVIETSVRLCASNSGHLAIRQGESYRAVATWGLRAEHESNVRSRFFLPGRDTVIGRTLLERQIVHVADLAADPEYGAPEAIKVGRSRTVIAVPLMREGEPIGVMALSRRRVEPFTERQIDLVRTFADQAVIAIENTRLITETREALEQQTATAEVLQVINSSPGNLAPVYAAILEKAHNLCGVAVYTLQLYEGTKVRAVALRGVTGQWAELLREPFEPAPESPPSRLLGGERIVHIIDLDEFAKQQSQSGDPRAQASAQQGLRTALWVPLRKDAELWGYISAFRQEVRPFSDKEIALLESFAAQAVIAIDNARLLNEIRQRQAELRVTFDNMGDGVAMFDSDQRLAAWNLNFQHILELPDALLATRPRVAEFVRHLATHGEFGAVDVEAEVRRLSERVGTQWSAERTRPDGQVIEVRSNPVPGGGVVLIYSDITERKRAEAEIRAARDTAEKALQELQTTQASLVHAQKMAALGQLTAGIAHEIKNPLNFVNNFAELSGELLLELKETTAPAVAALGDDERAAVDEVVEMLRANLDKIAEHGKRADGIVKSMLEHSRGVSGERREVDVNALVDEALNLAYHGARAQDASFNITLEREFDRGLAPIELAPQEITRVLLNLFGNGFYAATNNRRDSAGAEFRPTLKVTTRDLGETIEVRVRDNGTGITPEIRDRLFQPFVTTKPTGEGTGLGLSIAWDIVTHQHGGTIEVDSRAGEFTEFTIRLPRTYRTTAEAAS
jgi:two-component system NtrC family sensor kinase